MYFFIYLAILFLIYKWQFLYKILIQKLLFSFHCCTSNKKVLNSFFYFLLFCPLFIFLFLFTNFFILFNSTKQKPVGGVGLLFQPSNGPTVQLSNCRLFGRRRMRKPICGVKCQTTQLPLLIFLFYLLSSRSKIKFGSNNQRLKKLVVGIIQLSKTKTNSTHIKIWDSTQLLDQ